MTSVQKLLKTTSKILRQNSHCHNLKEKNRWQYEALLCIRNNKFDLKKKKEKKKHANKNKTVQLTLIMRTALRMSRMPSYTRRDASMNSFSSTGCEGFALKASTADSTCSVNRGMTTGSRDEVDQFLYQSDVAFPDSCMLNELCRQCKPYTTH